MDDSVLMRTFGTLRTEGEEDSVRLALNKACSPSSAICSSSLRFSLGLRVPSLSAA